MNDPEIKDKYDFPRPAELCRRYSISALKGLGQNFLNRPDLLRDMADYFDLDEGASVLEIGPGLGHLSYEILKRGAELTSIEIDERLIPVLKECLPFPRFHLIEGDARSFSWSTLTDPSKKIYFYGNLPYYISTELFVKALIDLPHSKGMAFLLQNEAARRLCAPYGSKLYGPPAILASAYGNVEWGPRVSKGSFYPQPDIESRIFYLRAHKTPTPVLQDMEGFYRFLCLCFSMRRKTLRNNLKTADSDLQAAGGQGIWSGAWAVMADKRAEEAELDFFIQLYQELKARGLSDILKP